MAKATIKSSSSGLLSRHNDRQKEDRQQTAEYREVCHALASQLPVDSPIKEAARAFAISKGWNFDADISLLRSIHEFESRYPDPQAAVEEHFDKAARCANDLEALRLKSQIEMTRLRTEQSHWYGIGLHISERFASSFPRQRQLHPHLFLSEGDDA